MSAGVISQKGDIFSLGHIIIEIIVGRMGDSHVWEMGRDSFSEHVREKNLIICSNSRFGLENNMPVQYDFIYSDF
jgi:hypothetical protein